MADYRKLYKTDKDKIDRIKALEKENARLASMIPADQISENRNDIITSDMVGDISQTSTVSLSDETMRSVSQLQLGEFTLHFDRELRELVKQK